MNTIWTKLGPYHLAKYKSEAELEESILRVKKELFGKNSVYLPVKRRIGSKGGNRNIPDGYLLDLRSTKPRLYVVENELAAHDPLKHIAVQILQFSLSFEEAPHAVKKILLSSLDNAPEEKGLAEGYAKRHGYRNLDHLLEWLVFESPFGALVIIDELVDNLENVLLRKFQFGVEVLELSAYDSPGGDRVYGFTPFLADLAGESLVPEKIDLEVDTVVVPARPDGFKEVFLGENRWYEIRLHGAMRPQIKFIAGYQTAPVSAITHIAPVKSIEVWKDTGKYVVNFSEPAREIAQVRLVKKGRVKALQNLRYTRRDRLLSAKTLDDVW